LRPFGGSKVHTIESSTTTIFAAENNNNNINNKYSLRYAAALLKVDKIKFIKTEGLTFALLAGPMGQAASMCRFRGCRYKNKNKNHKQQQQQQQQTPTHSPQQQQVAETTATTGEKHTILHKMNTKKTYK